MQRSRCLCLFVFGLHCLIILKLFTSGTDVIVAFQKIQNVLWILKDRVYRKTSLIDYALFERNTSQKTRIWQKFGISWQWWKLTLRWYKVNILNLWSFVFVAVSGNLHMQTLRCLCLFVFGLHCLIILKLFTYETDVIVAFQQIQNVLWIPFDRVTGFLKERLSQKPVSLWSCHQVCSC